MAEQEETLPRATVQKIVKDIMASDENVPSIKEFGCAKETIDVLCQACVEFIRIISDQSNEICEQDKKKTIAPEHIIDALKTLGWEGYEEDLRETWEASKEQQKVIQERQATRVQVGMTDEQLLAEQERLFAASKARFQAGQ